MSTNDLFSRNTRHFFHERVPHTIEQVAIINNDSFLYTFDDLLVELDGVT